LIPVFFNPFFPGHQQSELLPPVSTTLRSMLGLDVPLGLELDLDSRELQAMD
jgi:hypothetical protein